MFTLNGRLSPAQIVFGVAPQNKKGRPEGRPDSTRIGGL
ncbi:hypothetical protein R2A130_2939 [Ahrensia sp. R2A130]|nr:hypothetical protein R2A130_2939 [Ahrensia sp. R2A130]